MRVSSAGGDRPRLAGYEILGELGRGGMGVVYLARELELARLVALKMIPAGSPASPQDLTRFRREAEAVARLHHPGIVQIHAIGQLDDRPYLVLEYCAGGSLEAHLEGRPLPPRHAAALVETLARAMHHAHECGILHRDLKPANILLQMADRSAPCTLQAAIPKIADFGLAKRLDASSMQTHSGAPVGTPSYMAPEQAAPQPGPLDARVDVYALGAILYELVTGRPPFRAESLLGTLESVVREDPVPPSCLHLGCPQDLETIILTCLHKERRRRYSSALALAEDCAAFCRGEPIRARATPPWERAVKWARRNPAVATLLAGACAGVLTLVTAVGWHVAELRRATLEARAQEKATLETRQRNEARAEAQALLLEAKGALARGEWEEARVQADKLLTTFANRLELTGLRHQAQAVRDDCLRRLALRRQYREFDARRDEARFYATQFTGLDAAANWQRAAAAARAGLVPADELATRGALGLSEAEQADVRAGRAELHLILAEALSRSGAGRRAEAVQSLEAFVALDLPLSRAYHLRLARYLSQLGRAAEAERQRAAAQAREPVTAHELFLLGDEHRLQGDLAQACRDFEKAVNRQPNHFWARYGLAFCQVRLGQLAEARASLTACLGHRSSFAWLYTLRGFVHGELGDYRSAGSDFQRALALEPDAATRYGIFANRGVVSLRQAQAVEPVTALEPAVAWLPAGSIVATGLEGYRVQRLAQAAADLQAAIALQPANYQAHVNLAQVYTKQQRLAAARAEYDEAIRLAPRLADLYRLRAEFAWQNQDFAGARQDLEQAVRLQAGPSSALADDHVKLGQLYQRQRRHEDAVRASEAALRAAPEHAPALRLQAVSLLELRRYPEAASALDRYLALHSTRAPTPLLAEAYRLRGLTRAQLGRYDGALEDYTRALELQPDAATRTYRGWLYLAQGAAKLAHADFDSALQLAPTSADAHVGRGQARARLGRWRDALHDAETALQLGPQTPRLLRCAAAIFTRAQDADPDAAARHQQRALELLAAALAATPTEHRARFWDEQLRTDPELASLRALPAFRALAPRPITAVQQGAATEQP